MALRSLKPSLRKSLGSSTQQTQSMRMSTIHLCQCVHACRVNRYDKTILYQNVTRMYAPAPPPIWVHATFAAFFPPFQTG